ncbi:acetyl-CoA carboxylase biotin carboxylase subunit family protein [Erwinia mallotivora]|uniref:ATP-grasp domain-containing protein n=1 Tax=Erwinia mallotivora TaxID=69222 RepID=UPI0035EC1226
MKNKVLIVGAISSYSVRQFYEATINLNKVPVFLFHDGHIPQSTLLSKDNHIVTNCLSINRLEKTLSNIQFIIEDVFSVVPGGELAVPLTEQLCEVFELPFNKGDINRFRNKKIMREWLGKVSVAQPEQYGVVDSEDKVRALAGKLKFPLIIKPVDGAASFFVKKIYHEEELADAVSSIIAHKTSLATGVQFEGQAILEQYIEGVEYSAEVMVCNGECKGFYITRKLLSDEPYFDEIGHISLSPECYPENCEEFIFKVIDAMEVDSGVLHIEFRQNVNSSLYLIEVACRIAGDLISNLVQIKHGYSLEEFYIIARSVNSNDEKEEKMSIKNLISLDNLVGIKFLFGEEVHSAPFIKIIQQDIAQKYVKISNRSPQNVVNRTGYIIFETSSLNNAVDFIKDGLC